MTALNTASSFLSELTANPKFLTLLSALIFPVICAIAVFVCLRHSGTRRRLLCYFLGLPVYVLPTLFLLSELGQTAEVLYPGLGSAVPDDIGFLAALALGIAYTGIISLICSDRVMKTAGQIFLLCLTLVFFALESALTYQSVVALTGTSTAHTLNAVLGLPAPLGDFTVCAGGLVCFVLYLIGFFLSFLFNKGGKLIKNEDIDKLHRIKAEARRIRKEGVCAVCVYSDACPGDRGNVRCSRHGNVPRDGRCRSFEYDPLKRIPEKKNSEEATEATSDEN